jgi:hypothetical protein
VADSAFLIFSGFDGSFVFFYASRAAILFVYGKEIA